MCDPLRHLWKHQQQHLITRVYMHKGQWLTLFHWFRVHFQLTSAGSEDDLLLWLCINRTFDLRKTERMFLFYSPRSGERRSVLSNLEDSVRQTVRMVLFSSESACSLLQLLLQPGNAPQQHKTNQLHLNFHSQKMSAFFCCSSSSDGADCLFVRPEWDGRLPAAKQRADRP